MKPSFGWILCGFSLGVACCEALIGDYWLALATLVSSYVIGVITQSHVLLNEKRDHLCRDVLALRKELHGRN